MRLGRRLVALVIAIVAMVLVVMRRDPGRSDDRRLSWVATARQLGVVGYRDPVGVLSPDGRRLAYAEGRNVRVVPVAGGASATVPAAVGQVRSLAWSSDGTLVSDDTRALVRWWRVDPAAGTREPLFGERTSVEAVDATSGGSREVRLDDLRQITPSPDGAWLAAVAAGPDGPELWRLRADGASAEVRRIDGRLSAPAWTPAGDLACVVAAGGRSRVQLPCGDTSVETSPDIDAVGPLAFSPDGAQVYFASPNDGGTVDLWVADLDGGEARRLTAFDRDSYAPTVAADGAVLFKVQSYRTVIGEVHLPTGRQRQLTTFQAETPSYDPAGETIAVTFGTWRRVIDDVNYPDIAQEIGTIPAGSNAGLATAPTAVIADSVSEDQAMAWSPNGRWIALHSHRELSDDVWLRPADGSKPDRRLTFLGRGAEVGWPRWSADGRFVLLDGASPDDGRSVMFVIGVDQDTGEPTSELREIPVEDIDGEISHAEWLGGSETVAAIAREAPGQKVIFTVPVRGGRARVLRRFASEHDFSGLAASPDGREVAYVERAPDGFFQVFRLGADGRTPPVQVTFDPSDKTQPAWAPDGDRVAYTVWSYLAHFWLLR